MPKKQREACTKDFHRQLKSKGWDVCFECKGSTTEPKLSNHDRKMLASYGITPKEEKDEDLSKHGLSCGHHRAKCPTCDEALDCMECHGDGHRGGHYYSTLRCGECGLQFSFSTEKPVLQPATKLDAGVVKGHG